MDGTFPLVWEAKREEEIGVLILQRSSSPQAGPKNAAPPRVVKDVYDFKMF